MPRRSRATATSSRRRQLGDDALRLCAEQTFHVVLTDLRMPGTDGMTVLRALRADQPDVEVIVLTAHGTVETAVDAMKLGAFDYLQKPVSSPAALRLLVSRALERRNLLGVRDRAALDEPGEPVLTWGDPAMVPIVTAIKRVAATSATVLLVGESGTGKEVAARALHHGSSRARGPFVAVNCAALAEQLLESELFGHEKGAFTGATERRRGRIESPMAARSSSTRSASWKPELQAKLLRALQERRIERVGSSRGIEVDVRWVAATNRDLHAMMRAGTFREDLYHRLAVFPIQLPPLRARRADIAPLADALLARACREQKRAALALSSEARAALVAADWPGNVRELANVLERAAILCDGGNVGIGDLWIDVIAPSAAAPARPVTAPGEPATLEDHERVAIERALALHGGNRRKAAEHLGIGLRTLYDKLKKYDP